MENALILQGESHACQLCMNQSQSQGASKELFSSNSYLAAVQVLEVHDYFPVSKFTLKRKFLKQHLHLKYNPSDPDFIRNLQGHMGFVLLKCMTLKLLGISIFFTTLAQYKVPK